MLLNKSMVVVDHSLKGFEGHHYEYSLASAKALAGLGRTVTVCCHKSFGQRTVDGIVFQPDFSVGWTDSTRFEKFRLWAQVLLRGLFGRFAPSYFGRFGSELSKVLFARSREIFVHTLSFTQLVEVLEVIPLQREPVQAHVVLRYDPGHDGFFNLKNRLLKILFRRAQGFPIQYYSDTPELCQNLSERFGINVKLLPILFESLQVSEVREAPIKISYLGDARLEKGFQHLPEIINKVLSAVPSVQFLIQLHVRDKNPTLLQAAEEIRTLASRDPMRVVIQPGALGPAEYKALIEKSDLILLPYEATAYRWRSSGILVQGAAAGKVVIVPRGTSMETMVNSNPTVTFNSPSEIPKKLIEICQNWPTIQSKAIAEAPTWQKRHSPESFAHQILG